MHKYKTASECSTYQQHTLNVHHISEVATNPVDSYKGTEPHTILFTTLKRSIVKSAIGFVVSNNKQLITFDRQEFRRDVAVIVILECRKVVTTQLDV